MLNKVKALFKNESMALLAVLVVYAIFVSSINRNFTSWNNIRNILVQVAVPGVIAIGMFVTMLTCGTDLSVAWLLTFLSCGAVRLMTTYNVPVWAALAGLFATAVLLEGLMGFIVAKTNLNSFIVSLGFGAMYQSFSYLISDGSEMSAGRRLEKINTFVGGVSTLVFICAAVAIVVILMLKYTKYGRRMYAVGCNQDAAYLSGINIIRFKMSVFMLNGLLVGLAAVMQIARLNSASPSMGSGQELSAIAACVVGGTAMSGGKGSLVGVLIGVILLGCINNSMTMMRLSPYIADFFKGLIIVVSVVMTYLSTRPKKRASL